MNPYGLEVMEVNDVKYVKYDEVKVVLEKIEDKEISEILQINKELNVKNVELKDTNYTLNNSLIEKEELLLAIKKENKRLKETLKSNGIVYESYQMTVLYVGETQPKIYYYLTKEEVNQFFKDHLMEIDSFSYVKMED